MKYDREISCYKVVLCDYVSSIGAYRYYSTKKFYTEEEAIAYAREALHGGFKVKIEQISNIVNWNE